MIKTANLTTDWSIVIDFATEVKRKILPDEGFEVYCENETTIQFAFSDEKAPVTPQYTLQKNLIWKVIAIPPTRILWARTTGGVAVLELEI